MRLEQIVLQFISLPLKTPFETSFGQENTKRAWLVTVRGEGIEGYGECVASDQPLYSEETHASAYYALRDHIIPRLAGDIGHPREIFNRLESLRGNRMAKAAIETAIWDWYAKCLSRPLYQILGGQDVGRIPVGVSIGIQADVRQLCQVAEGYWQKGYMRLKIKIRPDWDIEPLTRVRRHLGPGVPIMADANSAYTLAWAEHLQQLDSLQLMMIEQPLAYDDIIDHGKLAQRITTPICLDESIHTADDVAKAWEIGALGIVNLKIGRVGGYTASLAIEEFARSHQIPLWCGGMLETGIGRAHNVHLTTLPGFTLPGDTSASDRYFDRDIITEPFVLNSDGTLNVPEGPGIGVSPDLRRIRDILVYQEVLPIPAQPLTAAQHERRFPDIDLGR
ncbi:MAG: o-succinylbenzoate synthase [Firmicutes bacterium]|uniref:o-succinylbenzoate synthase n=1 Tax=Sulfobacillus benefaciens TaxID=453960 RepID=A0A2T2WZY2_9FIRM|nr:o-succinylbenzoate synthase [Bacillota bacterium]MCL5014139.1 o-succinylbenzoate synthase [Bacillota bacterium]PSR27788.1 MAG: o-succinylbenzoate synthase [Sulfobacillus benefaciens]